MPHTTPEVKRKHKICSKSHPEYDRETDDGCGRGRVHIAALPTSHRVQALREPGLQRVRDQVRALLSVTDDDRMHAVRHRAVGEKSQLVGLGVCLEPVQVDGAVGVGRENARPAVAALRSVMGNVREYDPVRSRHAENPSAGAYSVEKKTCLTAFSERPLTGARG